MGFLAEGEGPFAGGFVEVALGDVVAGEADLGGGGFVEADFELAEGGLGDGELEEAFDVDAAGSGEGVGDDLGVDDGIAPLQGEA